MGTTPSWLKKPQERVDALVKQYEDNVRRMAVRLAIHENSNTIGERHVNNAHEALIRSGLSMMPWFKSQRFKTSVGGFFVGASFSLYGLVPLTPIQKEWIVPASWCVLIICLLIGLIFYVWGFLDG